MDHSFSTSNLRRIWDAQTRRGHDLLVYYPLVREAYDKLRKRRKEIRLTERSVPLKSRINFQPTTEIAELREAANEALTQALAGTSDQLVSSVESATFSWGLKRGRRRGARQLYQVGNDAATFFADKQLQRSIASLTPARVSSRQAIVGGLVGSLSDDLPKSILRLDVESFYESVDHDVLMGMLRGSYLTPSSLRLIAQLLDEMAALEGRSTGLPAGVGVSAKLAEFYMTEIDRDLRDRVGVMFYARYVDDMIIVRGELEASKVDLSGFLAEIQDLLGRRGLRLNPVKLEQRQLDQSRSFLAFEFLGYSIEYSAKHVRVSLTDSRVALLKFRVDRTFDLWDRADPSNHGRRRLLLDRVRFLAGNTRLSNNKRNAMVGIYFSNPHVNNLDQIRALDAYLVDRRDRSRFPPEVETALVAVSFEQAFTRRAIRRFKGPRMKELRGAWRG